MHARSIPLLDAASALTNPGSLLSADNHIVAPYDLEISDARAEGYRPLSVVNAIRNRQAAPFAIDYSSVERVHVINGMGVTLGDSVIGITALMAIKRRHPRLAWVLYRPAFAPLYVNELYELAAPLVGSIERLPLDMATLSPEDFYIDTGNHLFWESFASMPMIDFFLWALGVTPDDIDARFKSNDWLKRVDVPVRRIQSGYTLFCPTASTPIRSMPAFFWTEAVNALWQKYRLPVLGFGQVDHPEYRDIGSLSNNTAAFIGWIKHARALLTTDSSAVHIAAGFDIPTLSIFTSIASALRVRDYRYCVAIDLPTASLDGVQASGRRADVERVERAYRDMATEDWAARLP